MSNNSNGKDRSAQYDRTQGRDGMELSLFSRDVIAMSTAVSLSHDVFDGVRFL